MSRNLIRFDPFSELEALRSDAFDDRLLRALRNPPTTDVYTDDNGAVWVVESHLPNFDEKDIIVNIDGDRLVVQAERHEQDKDGQKKYVLKESSSSFYRSIALPEHADRDAITADYSDGLLTVRVPLKQAASQRRISIGRRS